MNFAEDIAITYLRLNGFFVLPHFTMFAGDQHNHVDILALHPANGGQEKAGDSFLPVDEVLFKMLTQLTGKDAKSLWLGIIAEVKSGSEKDFPPSAHVEYVKPFLGDVNAIALLSFRDTAKAFEIEGGTLLISNAHACEWFDSRVETMDKTAKKLTKSGSWSWSEERLKGLLQGRRAWRHRGR